MPLSSGSRFGAFEILAPLGAGAMGEVYRSRDTRLQRDVALKVLPDAVAFDPDRLARFTREAQMLAALNHPNIAAIHGVERDGERHALVLELVDGPTLAERIADGALPVQEALLIARQLAEALEAAHEQGIIHRDLKPANIKLRVDGTVKVLDFGLAKAIARSDSAGSASRFADVTASPTVMAPATMTTAGIILGTAAYMAPEQARGRALDRRADIWAFGCVLFEMLAGRRAFDGEEVTDVLASILKDGPRWDALPADTPPAVLRLLRRCLEKDPRERLQAIGDARIEITDALHPSARPEEPVAVHRVPSGMRRLPLVIACTTTALIAAIAAWTLKPDATPARTAVTRSLIAIDPFDRRPPPATGEARQVVGFTSRNAVALSPDGRVLAFRGNAGGAVGWQIYVRQLDQLEPVPIPNTAGGENPFFSPDGAWIGYAAAGELRRVPVGGGPATTIARLTGRIQGASWGGDLIVFATTEGMWRVSASGGTAERVGEIAPDEYRRVFPHILPGGGAVLFTRQRTVFRWDDAQILVRSLSTGEERVLLDDAADARYVPSGHLLFMRRGTLMAAPFDPDRLEMTGGAVTVVANVQQAANIGNSGDDTGAGQFATSAGGALVYVTGGVFSDEERELVWVDRNGTVEPIPAPKREYVSAARVSPDGTRILAFTSASVNDGGSRLWVYDVTRRAMTPLSAPDERVSWALWSPDGSRVAYMTLLAGRAALSLRAADGTGSAERLEVEGNISSWSRDDRIALVQGTPTTRSDIWVVDLAGADRKAQPVLQTAADERYPVFSPDGKWLAFVSDESGRPDVYIQPYPGPGPRVLVSPTGGIAPAWRGDGAELFYTVTDVSGISMRAVSVTGTPSGVSVGMPRRLFDGQYSSGSPARGYDVTADGQRFVMVRVVNSRPPESNQMVLVENWFEELKQLAPSAR